MLEAPVTARIDHPPISAAVLLLAAMLRVTASATSLFGASI
jgi:hypothetical protein